MRYCKSCKVHYETPLEDCLLCSDKLNHLSEHESYNFPPYKAKSKFTKYFIKGTLFLNVISIIISLSVNYLVSKEFTWSLIVSASNVYILLFVKTLLSDVKFITRLILMITLSILEILAIAFLTSDPSWAIEIVLPFSIILNTIILLIFTFFKKKRWQDYTLFLILSTLTNMGLILLPIFNVTTNNWAIISSFFVGLFTLLALIVFTPKNLKEEFLRRFHI